jgi:hypothetical protein
LVCPVQACGGQLGPWGWGRKRRVWGLADVGGVEVGAADVGAGAGRGEGRSLRPRRSRCRVCLRSHILLPADVLLRRVDDVAVIGKALLAAAGGLGHRGVAGLVGRPATTVRGWMRRCGELAGVVLAVFGVAAAGFGVEFVVPAPAVGRVGQVVEMVGALGRAVGRRLGGSRSPWRVAAVVTGGRLLSPGGPDLVAGVVVSINTSSL